MLREVLGRYDLLGRQERPFRCHRHPVVHVEIAVEELCVAAPIRAVQVHEGDIELQCRYRQQHLGFGPTGTRVGRSDGPQIREDAGHVGAEPCAGRQERHPPRRRLEAEQQHPLVPLRGLDRAGLAGDPVVGLEWDRIQRDETRDHLAHLARPAEQPDVGAAVADDGQVVDVGPQQLTHQRHRLAPRTPATDPDGHAATQLADDLGLGRALVGYGHALPPVGLTATSDDPHLTGRQVRT